MLNDASNAPLSSLYWIEVQIRMTICQMAVSYKGFLALSGQPCRFIPSIHENIIRKY